ncbi:hypothetical protein NDI44_16105 [Trichocoleus sp. DQ-A3]|uniref:hypothetical protein n=1 Tax=Cyanophyceae TaxID=3028117 RepID=UPI0018EFC97C|nr:hypothetical protein [Coleofasciculus sp. FACHB-125]
MVSYQEHEVFQVMIWSLIKALADESKIEIMQLGSLTLEREEITPAVEADTCFYIQNKALSGDKK